jgi:clathrin heavy chain
MEIGNPAPGNNKFKVMVDISMAADAPGDFPILMQASPKYGLVFMITKMGYLFMFETYKGSLIYRQRITDQLIFTSVRNLTTDGVICISKAGQVLSINVEEANLVKFVMNAQHIPDNKNVAFRMAQRYGLSGADDIFVAQFNQCFATGDYAGAARAARESPGTLLRNQDTINKFKSLPQPPNGPHPSLIYFSTLLETSKLNEIESLVFIPPVLQQGKGAIVEDWIAKDKLTMSDALGDVIR